MWEYGNWKLVTGAVDEGESTIAGLGRELHEEVGAQRRTFSLGAEAWQAAWKLRGPRL